MFSKDPSELVRKEPFDREETVRSIRLAMAAEIDAINFYLQQARHIPEGPFKAVHEDIAREEIAHFGEFMRLLLEYSPEDFKRMASGWEEASRLIGKAENFPFQEKGSGGSGEAQGGVGGRLFPMFREVEWKEEFVQDPEDAGKVHQLSFLTHQVEIRRDLREEVASAVLGREERKFSMGLKKEILVSHPLSPWNRSTHVRTGQIGQAGQISSDIITGIDRLSSEGYDGDLGLIVSPEAMKSMNREIGGTGVLEIDVVRPYFRSIVFTPVLEGLSAMVVHIPSVRVLVRMPPETEKRVLDASKCLYMMHSKLAPMTDYSGAVARLQWKD